jgi:hypothetical protein
MIKNIENLKTKFNFYKLNRKKLGAKLQENQSLRGQLRAKLKKFKTKDLFEKGARIPGPNSIKNRGEIEEIINLKVN